MPAKKRSGEKHQLQKVTLLTGIAILALVAGGVGFYFLQNQGSSVPEVQPAAAGFRLDSQPSLGSPEAPVKVVEFGDYKCPACRQFHQDVYPKVLLDYIDMNLVEFFFINFQFLGPDSTTAGIAGECIYNQNQNAFWDYFNTMYENQGPESQTWATPERILELVKQSVHGVDEAALLQCIQQRKYEPEVEADKQLGLVAGVTGTPSIFVNGIKLNSWSYPTVRAAIESELDKAKQ